MGAMIGGNCTICMNTNHKQIKKSDLFIETKSTSSNTNKKQIILIQSVYRGYIFRKMFFNCKQIKEVSIDYNTEQYEKHPIIINLRKLLPKFELTEKQDYEINKSNNKITALLYPNKSIYKGMINNKGQFDGFGKYYMADGSMYKGFFRNGKMEGSGRLININGFAYEGEFKNGKFYGFGKYVSLDGIKYKGTWNNDKQNGLGSETYPDGSVYNGNFIDGKKNGNGKLIFKDKNFFEGNFFNNEMNGEGAFYWKDGRVYIGQWAENKMNGYGIFIWPDKKKYYGKYLNNLKDGYGVFQWGDGHKYEGFWKKGKQNEYGILSNKDSIKYGFWNEGIFQQKINSKIIYKKIEEVKNQKDYISFIQNIDKYEKHIIDGSSSQDTNFNSKVKK